MSKKSFEGVDWDRVVNDPLYQSHDDDEPTAESQLLDIQRQLESPMGLLVYSFAEHRRRGFLRGRAFEITSRFEKHPEFWNTAKCGCNCDECGDRA